MKKILFLLFLFCFSVFFISPACSQTVKEDKLKMITDEETASGIKYLLIDDEEYLSLQEIKRIYDAKVHWYPVSGKVLLNLDGKKVEFFIETKKITINGISRKLENPIRLVDDKVYLPIDFLQGQVWQKVSGGRTLWDWNLKTFTFTRKPLPEVSSGIASQTTDFTVSPLVETSSAAVAVGVEIEPTSLTEEKKRNNVVKIVIDPGHGGKDPGAISRRGTREKELNLLIAKELARVLAEDYGYRVILTRKDDTFVPLFNRAEIANQKHADLFVSIHCNSSISRRLNGFEIYFLSEKATDSEAQAVALRENAVIALEDVPLWKQKEIERILWSMETNTFLNQSSGLAGVITQRIEKKMDIDNPRVKQATFSVLRGARMPAILVEVGYLSHRNEESRLRTRKYREQIVRNLAEGIHSYCQTNSNLKRASSE